MERTRWNRGKEGRTDSVRERKEKQQGRKGSTTKAESVLLLSALAWGQKKVGALKSVAFSDTQFRLVKGRKETRCVSASRVCRLLQAAVWMARPLNLLSSYPRAG